MTIQHVTRLKSKRSPSIKTGLMWVAFTFGSVITILAIAAMARFERGTSDRQEAIASLVLFGLMPIAVGTGLAWERHRCTSQERCDRLQNAFYTMVRNGRGRMSVLTFAMEAGVSGTEARAFLDARSHEFQAQFDVTEQGEIIYRFDLCRE
ncbi:MAG: hypothetical protein IGR76_18100 [Synechococcales cyanobacterium T60_A2020_003]|nr:hypothetical protein [Synechococcales cyanobacterium T60_A2020_003]